MVLWILASAAGLALSLPLIGLMVWARGPVVTGAMVGAVGGAMTEIGLFGLIRRDSPREINRSLSVTGDNPIISRGEPGKAENDLDSIASR